MNTRIVEQAEFDSLAKLHIQAFNNFFLTTLGSGFLQTYYQTCLKSKEAIAVCATNEKGEIIGFGMGCILSKGFHKRLVFQNFTKFSLQALRIIFTNPKAIFRLSYNLDKNSNKIDDGNYAELLSIAVSPAEKGSGVGKKMIAYFEAEAKAKGCLKVALTTDYYNNDDVIAFYKRSGYEMFYEFSTYPNRRMYKMIKEIK
jgi:ribosomal protein S18 acetylase RimI-like enzyme